VTALATWGLFVAWVVHDIEELFTMPHWGRRNATRLRRMYPRVPERVWSALDPSRVQVAVAIGLVGLVMLGAAVDGARTGGRSPYFQIALLAFGLHAIVHLGQSALARGYTPGVVTAVLVVAPFSWWAWGRLGGPVGGSGLLGAILLIPLVVGAAQGIARLVARR
jgi:Protein of unknown function with HXXEE motif